MKFSFLSPVDNSLLSYRQTLANQSFGGAIEIHTEEEGIPQIEKARVALIGINEYQKDKNNASEQTTKLIQLRKQLYRLFVGNWNIKIIDLGDINQGETVRDTHFAVRTLSYSLMKQKVIPLFFGGDQDISYPIYRSFDELGSMVNMVSVDNKFDFGDSQQLISSSSYMSKIVMEEPNNLNHFANLGYQTFFSAQEEIDLMEKLFFEYHRLGVLFQNIKIAEPVMRNADFVSFDMGSLKAADVGMEHTLSPTGIDSVMFCTLARYAGISDRVAALGFFNFQNTLLYAQILAQGIWYFIEGVNYRLGEYPKESLEKYIKYTVLVQTDELVFYKSPKSKRWWIKLPNIQPNNNKSAQTTLLPCEPEDYQKACQGQIPERWLKVCKKIIA